MTRYTAISCVFVAFLFLSALVVDAQYPADTDPWETIDSLRASDDFEGALAIARELVIEGEADPDTPAYKLGDARREVTTLERILQFDPADRAAMAEAARQELAIFEHYDALEYEAAATAARRLLELIRRHLGDRHHETADAANLYATLLEELDEIAAADDLFAFAYDVYNEVFEPVHEGRESVLNNWALVLEKMWRREEAIARQRQALAMALELFPGDAWLLGVSYNNLGAGLMETTRFRESREMLEEALRLQIEGGDPEEILRVKLNLAALATEQDDLQRARELIDDALKFIEDHPNVNAPFLADALRNKARLLAIARDQAGAEAIHRQVLDLRRGVWPERSYRVAAMHVDLAASLANQGRYDEADAEFTLGIATLEDIHPHGSPELYWAYRHRAVRYWRAGQYEQAVDAYAQAAQMYEQVRFRLGEWGSLDYYQTPWFDYAASLLMSDRPVEAWQALEAGQGRLLADALRVRHHEDLDAGEAATLQALTFEAREARRLLTELPASGADPGGRSGTFDDAVARLRAATAALVDFQVDLSRAIIADTGRAVALARVQQALAPGEAIVGWLQVDAGVPTARAWGYVVRHEGPVRWVADLPVARTVEAQPAAQQCAVAIRNDQAWEALAATAWQERVAPLLPHLDGVDYLIAAPAGDMRGVPLEVLGPRDQERVGDQFQVSYTPSAQVFVTLRAQGRGEARTGSPRVLALGDPPFNARHLEDMTEDSAISDIALVEQMRGVVDQDQVALAELKRLEMSGDEARSVASLGAAGSLALIGSDCNELRVIELVDTDAMREFGIVHIATHALVHPDAPARSSLVLSQIDLPDLDPGDHALPRLDGLITAEEIAAGWHLDARLVALTGCETGLGRRQLGEGFLGFTNVFLQQGADAVLVSLWNVQDGSTKMLAERFYQLYLGGGGAGRTKALCLQEAKAWLQEQVDPLNGELRYRHPLHWAGLVLIGNAD